MTVLTEEVAKTKWCPLARMLSEVVFDEKLSTAACNRNKESFPFCLGAACMAWRSVERPMGEPSGYCGAFGKPSGA